jgi:hypothetical protein
MAEPPPSTGGASSQHPAFKERSGRGGRVIPAHATSSVPHAAASSTRSTGDLVTTSERSSRRVMSEGSHITTLPSATTRSALAHRAQRTSKGPQSQTRKGVQVRRASFGSGESKKPSVHNDVARRNRTVDDFDAATKAEIGFSADALLDRYTAEMEQTSQQKEQLQAASQLEDEPPSTTSLTHASSMFWISTPGGVVKSTSSSVASSPKPATGGVSASPSSPSAEFDISETYGRNSRRRPAVSPKGGVFGQKERFEHVDQSVNLMAMSSDESNNSNRSPTTGMAERRRKARSGRFGGQSSQSPPQGTSGSRYTGGKRNVFRTFSVEMSDVFLGNSRSKQQRDNSDIKEESENDLKDRYLDDDDDDDEPIISCCACCQCLCFTTLLLVIVLFMAGVIPLPEQWDEVGESVNVFHMPGFTSEKSGEDLFIDASPSGAPKRLYSPVPTSDPTSSVSTLGPTSSVPTSPYPSSAPTSIGAPTTITPSLVPTSISRSPTTERCTAIRNIVLLAEISASKELEQESSASCRALRWICDADPAMLDPLDFYDDANAELLERYALAVFFYATHDTMQLDNTTLLHRDDEEKKTLEAAFQNNPELLTKNGAMEATFADSILIDKKNAQGWYHVTGWMTGSTVCEWYGVQCHRSGRVSSVHLARNRLVGHVPAELRALRDLQHLNLSYNHLRQEIPSALFDGRTSWPDLVSLDLSNNRLSGSLPDGLGGFPQLHNFTVDNNVLTGEVPRSVAQLTSLELFSAQNNQLRGPIRDTSSIPNLRKWLSSRGGG